MAEQPVFSVVVLHYGADDLWKQTLDSVLRQDYPAIELVFADDGTPGFDCALVEEYVEQRKRSNLLASVVFSNSQNVGTVANLAEAHRRCSGRYLTHIAADDVYLSSDVLAAYAKALQQVPEDVLGVYGQSVLCDRDLNPMGRTYFSPEKALELNGAPAVRQFYELAIGCCIPMGATAFFREKYMPHELLAGSYRLLEDWPFFVRSTLSGRRFVYMQKDVLLYRDGGVSRDLAPTPSRVQCIKDTMRLYETEIFPNLGLVSFSEQMQVYYSYNQMRLEAAAKVADTPGKSRFQLLLPHKRLMVALLLQRIKSAKLISLCIAVWLSGVLLLALTGRIADLGIYYSGAVLAAYSLARFARAAIKCCGFVFSRRY